MINVSELEKGPQAPPYEIPEISDDAKIRQVLKANIGSVITRINEPIRTFRNNGAQLLAVSGDKPRGKLFGYDKNNHAVTMGTVENEQFQRVGVEVMRHYGLDIDIFNPKPLKDNSADYYISHNGVINRWTTSEEVLQFPSQTIPELVFERTRTFYTESSKNIWVSWRATEQNPGRVVQFRKLLGRQRPTPTVVFSQA